MNLGAMRVAGGMQFSSADNGGIRYWRGNPDCQAAHDELLGHLKTRNAPFLGVTDVLGTRRMGNLGEHIAFRIGDAYDFSTYLPKISNAANPLENISTSGIDIMWLLLGANPADDIVVLQETKTTGSLNGLDYADELVTDYDKLFAPSSPRTLGLRLQTLANHLEYELNLPPAILHRVVALAASSPHLCSQVVLVPTLVHDLALDPQAKLLAVRSTIASRGWNVSAVRPWSIALGSLTARLERIARGSA